MSELNVGVEPERGAFQGKFVYVKNFKIDTIVFSAGFVPFCNVPVCRANCCYWGVYVDLKEREKILAHKDLILKFMDETQPKDVELWFEKEEWEDPDFPSGKCVGTNVYNDKCVFLTKEGYCVLQVSAVNSGMHQWALKPFYCCIYPLTFWEGALTYDDDHAEDLPYCGLRATHNHAGPVIEICKDEFIYVLGEDGYAELLRIYDEWKKLKNK
ncbi:Protein of unknown function (DUF3109) [Candidatus Thermokryptus mobilis]|mgnify:CR=1 FL=1|uniref:DUF3109 family protein n=1 Tax=Candidatus Thermokryptus mobilis TaxID=1643428 RepID=A0A0S4N023_9BACT|nr:DUF3109 family protein [Candidatus Thermokryptus mobilis]CUU04091.1 Protein of unknown function (DUF3109) [Candidatus Thermokryptus mobilis]